MKQPVFSRRQLLWYYLIGILIVVGSVMSFGLISVLFMGLDENSAISMVFVIIPMSAVMYLVIVLMIRHMNKKLEPLLTGIHRVAEGDLTTQLDSGHAAEYTKIYEEFNSMVRELDATKTEMQNFTNEFAHEFKTPITSISGFADLLCEAGEELSQEERQEYLQIIAEQSRRLSHLSQNALLLSKVEATQILTERSDFSLTDQIEHCAVLLLKQMDEKNITLNLPEDVNVHFFGNAELMEQVWINLLSNAIKFTPENGTISVRAETDAKEILVSITDSGAGMSEETMQHIFEKYYQHDTTSLVKGNGIGLAIVQRIVSLSGGRVEVTSRIGQGSTFTVILPK